MFKKSISYIWISLILLNLFSNILFINQVNSVDNNRELEERVVINDSKNYAEDRLIVKFKRTVWIESVNSLQQNINSLNIDKVDYFNRGELWVVFFDNNLKNIDTLKSELSNLSWIEYVWYDLIRTIDYTWVDTNDTNSIDQWFLKSVKADDAWKIYNDTENKTLVSVNDTWIDYTHNDLSWNMKDLSSSCKDDTWVTIVWWCPNHWWNVGYNSSYPVLWEDDIFDIDSHWTHVAWTIWAVWNNGIWVIWVTQNVEIMWAKLDTFHTGLGIFYLSNIIKWINFAVENWAKVINASYGW